MDKHLFTRTGKAMKTVKHLTLAMALMGLLAFSACASKEHCYSLVGSDDDDCYEYADAPAQLANAPDTLRVQAQPLENAEPRD